MTLRLPSTPILLLNGAAALIAVATVVTMGRSIFGANEPESCRVRFDNVVQWTLQREDGQLLSTSDLQARLSGTDWGLMDRVSVVKADRPAGGALAVDLASRSASGQSNGAGFEWGPQSASRAAAACMSYSFKLDPKFDFAAGGRLPGLFGGPSGSDHRAPESFSARLAWNSKGELEVLGPVSGAYRLLANEREAREMPRGRWVVVDQEIIVNTPGRSDGILRVWLDGKLAFESHKVAFRTDASVAIRGVLAEVAYVRQPNAASATSSVLVTPFEFRW